MSFESQTPAPSALQPTLAELQVMEQEELQSKEYGLSSSSEPDVLVELRSQHIQRHGPPPLSFDVSRRLYPFPPRTQPNLMSTSSAPTAPAGLGLSSQRARVVDDLPSRRKKHEPPAALASLAFPPAIIIHIIRLSVELTVKEATEPTWPPFSVVRNDRLFNLALVLRQFRPCAYEVLYGDFQVIWLPHIFNAVKRTLRASPDLAGSVVKLSVEMGSQEWRFVAATGLGAAPSDSNGEEEEKEEKDGADENRRQVQESWEGEGRDAWEGGQGPMFNAASALFDVVQRLPNLDTLSFDQVGDTDSEVPLNDENVLSVLGNLEILSYRSSTAVDCRSPTLLDTLLVAVPRLQRLELDVPGRLVAQANTPLLPLLKTLHLTSSTEFLTTESHPFLRTLVQTLATIDISGSRSENLDSLSNVIATGDLKSLHVNWVTGRGPEEALLAPTAKLRSCIAQSHLERLTLDFTSSLPFTSIISNLPSTLVSLHLENDDLPVCRPPQYLRTQVAPADLTRILTGVLDTIKGKAGALRVVEYASRIQHWPEEVPEVIEAFRDEGLEGSRSRWRASRGDFSFSFWSAKGPGGRGVGGREGSSSRGCKDGESCCVMNLEPEE